MPLIANTNLPSFERLEKQGETILSEERASHQAIRALHIGLLNMMPDSALEATERQFFRLIGRSNQVLQLYIHPFSIPSIKRGKMASKHIEKYYKTKVMYLSSGERKKLELLRLVFEKKKLWVLDEPFNHLDDLSIEILNQTFLDHINNDGMILFASHFDPMINNLETLEFN